MLSTGFAVSFAVKGVGEKTECGLFPGACEQNRLPWRRDVIPGEDACQTRTGAVPSLLARLNSAVLCLMDRLGVGNVARQARYFDAHLEQAIQLLLAGHCSVF